MPYAEEVIGIYRIVNTVTNQCYVGQSQRVRKRIADHFNLLRKGKHPNGHLQNSFNKYGESAFEPHIEVVCSDVNDLDVIEEDFINGAAWFDSPVAYNIAAFSKAPMRGKLHSEETKRKISEGKRRSGFDYSDPEWKASLSRGQRRRAFGSPELMKKVKFIIENDHLSYAERGRRIGADTSSVRRLYLKYLPIKDQLP
jgi:group I intron endonuclease